jgi:hypothetical protein
MKIIIKENQYKSLHNSLNEQWPALVTALRSLLSTDPNSYRYLARNLDNLLLGNPPKVRRRVSPTAGASYTLNDGQSILQAYMRGHLTTDEAAEVVKSIFKSSTNDDIIESISKYFVEVDSDFIRKFKSGSLSFDDLSQEYGIRQSQAIRKAILEVSPLNYKYLTIFGDLDPSVAGKIVDKALVHAASKNVNIALKASTDKGKEVVLTNREDILQAVMNGRLTDFYELKKMIINSIPTGPLANPDPALTFVKNKIITDLTADDLIKVFEGKSIQEIKSSLSKDGITNPEVSSAIFKKLNPAGGAVTGFWSGVKADSAGKMIFRILLNKATISSAQTANPVFKNIDQEDFKKLLFWSVTGLGDYQKVKSIFNTYGKGAATANVIGQYVWSYISSAITVLALKTLRMAFLSIFSEKQIFPDEFTAWAAFVNQELLNLKNFAAGPIGRILVELVDWMWEKSPGGKLPVKVYQIIDRIEELLGIAEEKMENARENLPLNPDGTIVESGEEEINTGRD